MGEILEVGREVSKWRQQILKNLKPISADPIKWVGTVLFKEEGGRTS